MASKAQVKKARPSPSRTASAGMPENRYRLSVLRAAIKPYRLYWFSTVRSTNAHARHLRAKGRLFAPAVVLTGRQTVGRGRGNNTWWSNRGVLTVTFAMPMRESVPPQQIPLIAGLAVRETVAKMTGESQIQLKWPNDLLHEGRKLAGFLCERLDGVDMIGLGLNVNVDPSEAPGELVSLITSMEQIAHQTFFLTEVLTEITSSLVRLFRRRIEQPFSTFVNEYRKHDGLLGKTVTLRASGDQPALTGKCKGIDVAGRLLISARGKTHALFAGDVTIGSGGGLNLQQGSRSAAKPAPTSFLPRITRGGGKRPGREIGHTRDFLN